MNLIYKKKTILIFLLAFQINGLLAQSNIIDSLEKLLNNSNLDTIKLQLLSDLNWEYCNSNLEKAKNYAEQELDLAIKLSNRKYMAQAYNDIGIVLIKENKFKQAINYHQNALAIRLKLVNKSDIASSYSKIGQCYAETDEYKLALNYLLKTLTIYKELDNKNYIAYTLNNICYLYTGLKNYDKVLEYATQSYNIAKSINDEYSQASALEKLSGCFEKKGQFSNAILYQTKALNIFIKLNDSNEMAATYNNLGFYYRQIPNNLKAKAYYFKALAIASSIKDINSIGIYNNNIGNLFITEKQYDLAEKHLKIAEKICLDQSMETTLLLTYKSLGDLYALTNKGEMAVKNYNNYAALKDSIFSNNMAEQFSEMQTKYETNEKEIANQLLQKENAITTAELNKSNVVKWSLLIGIVLVVLVSYLFYNSYKLKQKHIFNQELLHQQEENSRAILDAEERERARIARDLHDGIGQQLSAAKLNIVALKNSINPALYNQINLFENATQLIDDAVNEVRSVSHNMMANSLIKNGLVSAVRDFIQKLNQSAGLKINIEIYGLDERLDNSVEIILFRVLQEIVNNIIKHANATEINIQFVKHDKELSLLVEDNGVGFDTKKIEYFEGIGLKNIELRIKFLKGNVYFDSFLGKGTTVNIEVPL
ncbi:MAG: tetratricopeptide repeat protein [Bacteroidia bacterium]